MLCDKLIDLGPDPYLMGPGPLKPMRKYGTGFIICKKNLGLALRGFTIETSNSAQVQAHRNMK
jgi:hypothetical protein